MAHLKAVDPKKYPGLYFYGLQTLHKGRPDKTYYISYQDGAGKKIWEKIGKASEGITPSKAAKIRAERIRTVRLGDEVIPIQKKRKRAKTFSQFFLEKYLPWAKAQKTSWVKEEMFHRLYLAQIIGKKPLSAITPFDLEKVKKVMRDKGLAPKTINYCLDTVRVVYNKAVAWGLFSGENPAKRVSRIKHDNRRRRFLSVEEARALLEELKQRSQQTYEIAVLALKCGLRFGEIANLRFGDIDLENGLLFIRDPKNRESRTAYITPEVREILEAKIPAPPEQLVFPSDTGGRMTQVSKSFDRTVQKLGFNKGITDPRQRITFHSLRHTFASWLAISGVPLNTIRELMGHKTLVMTTRYSHLSPSAKRKAMDSLPALFEEVKEVSVLK